MVDLRAPRVPISYSLAGAADATGYSVRTIERAIKAGEITSRYANSSPVIPHDELFAWVQSLPVDKPEKATP